MKRVSPDSLTPPSSEHKSKRHKTQMQSDDGEWTKVEKRKTRDNALSSLPKQSPVPSSNAFASLLHPQAKHEKVTDEEWSKVERRKAKKARKTEERSENATPRFFYVNSEILKRREAVTIGDIRDLVLHLLGEAAPQPWLKVENRQAIGKVVVLFAPGILPEHLNISLQPTSSTSNPNLPVSIPLPRDTPPSQTVTVKTLFGGTKEIDVTQDNKEELLLPFIARTFSHACPTRAPGEAFRMHSVLSAFFQGPVSPEERKRRAASAIAAEKGLEQSNPLRYVLTLSRMIENEYPIPKSLRGSEDIGVNSVEEMKEDDWVETPIPSSDESGIPEVFAIDCEMCITEDGKELTRVCAIDFNSGKVLLDQLVKPPKPILDYLTRWSGITEEVLRDINTPLSSARNSLLSIMNSSKDKTGCTPILLGHSLESDLRALKFTHMRCIDTALLYHHPRGRPLKPGLAWLTKKWCGREIQNRGEGGHDAEEDARACIELLQRKMKNGPGFGEYKTTTEQESIFERLKRSIRGSTDGEPGTGEGAKLRTVVIDRGNPASLHGAGAGTCIPCTSDEEVAKGILQNIENNDFIFARLNRLAEVQNWLQQRSSTNTDTPATPYDPSEVKTALKATNSNLSVIHAALPPHTALVLFTGHSDPREMVTLQSRKNAFDNAFRASQATGKEPTSIPSDLKWTNGDARDLEEAVGHARQGMLFLSLR